MFSQVSVILFGDHYLWCIGIWVSTFPLQIPDTWDLLLPHVTITHDAFGHGYLPLSPLNTRHATCPLATDISKLSLETCSNLFTWGPNPLPPQYWYLVMATKTCTVGKRVVHILLECCLLNKFGYNEHFSLSERNTSDWPLKVLC